MKEKEGRCKNVDVIIADKWRSLDLFDQDIYFVLLYIFYFSMVYFYVYK